MARTAAVVRRINEKPSSRHAGREAGVSQVFLRVVSSSYAVERGDVAGAKCPTRIAGLLGFALTLALFRQFELQRLTIA